MVVAAMSASCLPRIYCLAESCTDPGSGLSFKSDPAVQPLLPTPSLLPHHGDQRYETLAYGSAHHWSRSGWVDGCQLRHCHGHQECPHHRQEKYKDLYVSSNPLQHFKCCLADLFLPFAVAASGQADGLQCRTLEVLHSFGMADDIRRGANHMIEICFWNPINGNLQRTGRIPDTIPDISRFQQVVLHQGRIERLYLNNINRFSDGSVQVERAILPEKFNLDVGKVDSNEDDVYPVSIQVRQLSEEDATPSQMNKSTPNGLFRSALALDDTPDLLKREAAPGSKEVIHAKYVIGCDGAHSWTRKQMGYEMIGEQTDYIWGVLDAIPDTDFPDIRMRCAIHSEKSGSVMVIPREDGL
jgi:hypothetical protein